MSQNVFNENEAYLISAREEVAKRDSMAAELENMRGLQKRLTKNIANKEKAIADEISSTLKKRKQEISDTYDDRLDDNRARKKKVSDKRDKKKNQRINERIEDETKDIRKNTRELEIEMKTLLKKNKVPSFVSGKLFFVMFMPRGIGEVGAMLLGFVIYFLGIPSAVMAVIYQLVLSDKKDINMAFWCVLIVAVFLIIQLIIYFAVYSTTKLKHQDVVLQARSIRDKIKANGRQIAAIKNSINKDKDESQYNLGSYDEKLENLEKEADAIGAEKQEALRVFEEQTKPLIVDDINGKHLQALEDLKEEKKTLEDKISKGEKMYSEKVLQITNQYASYLGEDLCRQDKLSDLIAIMEDGDADTVSEAINYYKGQKSSK